MFHLCCKLSSSKVGHNEEIRFYVRYEYHGKRRATPLFLNHCILATLSVEDFTFDVIQGIPFLVSQLGITCRLSSVDGEDDIDLNSIRFLKVIMILQKGLIKCI